MHDREDDEVPPSRTQSNQGQDPIQELKNTAFLMSGLYKQLEEERSIVTTASSQMTYAAKQFLDYIKKFTDIDKQLKSAIAHTIHECSEAAASRMAEKVGGQVAAAATSRSETIIKDLKKTVNAASQELIAYHQTIVNNAYWRWGGFIAIALLSGLISAMTMHFYFPEQTFTQDQWNQMSAGATIQKAWGKLSTAEQDKILDLSGDKKATHPLKKKKPAMQSDEQGDGTAEN